EQHKEAGYVRRHRAAIVDLAKRAAFRAKCPPLDPKSVVKGTLLSWNARARKIKIRYDRKQMENWGTSGRIRAHPAVFTGPHTITLDGKYPNSDSPQAIVCFDGKRDFFVTFGLNGKHSQEQAEIAYREGGKTVQAARLPASLCTDTSNFPVRIIVKNKAVVATRGNRKMLSLRKKPGHWGRFAFIDDKSIERVTLEGRIEPAWMQGLLDKAETERRREFEAAFDPEEHLPEWLFEMPDVATELAEPDLRDWPGKLEGKETDLIGRVEQLRAEGRFDEGVAMAARSDADEAIVQFLKAICLYEMSDHLGALACARRVAQLDPAFVPVRELEARLLAHLGKGAEAADVYRNLLKKYPGGAELYGNAAMLLLSIDCAKEAREILGQAQVNDLSSPTLDHVDALLAKAENGPSWPRAYEYKSRHYHVVTDIDKKTCRAAAKNLEQAYVLYTVRLDRVKDAEQRRFKVYLFSGREGYLKYTADILGKPSETSAGLYYPLLKQFLIWNLPEREEMMRTVRHEGFHQYLDRLMPNPPAWFNEGLAEYYEIARVHRGQWRVGDANAYHLKTLSDKGIMPLKEFLYRDHASFMKKAQEHYAQSWAFIRFLRHSTRENGQLFERFWEALKTNPSRKAALDEALDGIDLDALETAFRDHLGQ
ncbi:MAG: DUF1570 domain-containing protein, partial [Planctomycetota bacterium]